jgi:O-antigen ligase
METRTPLHVKLFSLLLALYPVQLGMHFWPMWSMVLGRKIDYLAPTMYFTDLLVGILCVVWFAEARPIAAFVHASQKPFRSVFGVVLLFGVAAINCYFSVSPLRSVYMWMKIAEYALLGWYVASTRPGFSDILRPLSVALVYESAIGICQFFLQRSIGGVFWYLGERTFDITTPGIARLGWCIPHLGNCRELLRAYGTFPHPNVLGGFLAVIIIMALMELFVHNVRDAAHRWYYAGSVILGCAALVVSFSRSAWTILLVGVFLLPFLVIATRKFGRGMHTALFVLALCLVILSPLFRMPTFITEESALTRNALMSEGWTLFRRAPMTGVGLGSFIAGYAVPYVARQVYVLQPIHNVYLLWLVETGLVGFGILLYAVCRIFSPLVNVSLGRIEWQYLLLLTLGLGLVDHYIITLQQGQLLLTLLISLSLF